MKRDCEGGSGGLDAGSNKWKQYLRERNEPIFMPPKDDLRSYYSPIDVDQYQ